MWRDFWNTTWLTLVVLIREKNSDLRIFWHRKEDLFNSFLNDVKKNPECIFLF